MMALMVVASCGNDQSAVEGELVVERIQMASRNAASAHGDTELEIERCMAEKGFEYTQRVYSPPSPVASPVDLYWPNEPVLRESGFGFVVVMAETATEQRENTDFDASDVAEVQRYQAALVGVPDGDPGCAVMASRGANHEDIDQFGTLAEEFVQRVEADASTGDIFREWSRCMSTKGYSDIEDPLAMRDFLQHEIGDIIDKEFEQAAAEDSNRYIQLSDILEDDVVDELLEIELRLAEAHIACVRGLENRDEFQQMLARHEEALFGSVFQSQS